MKPLWNAPSLGTLHRDSTRAFTVAMILLSPFWMLLVILLSPYLVTIRAAWHKQPTRTWRTGVVVSIVLSVICVAVAAIWIFPQGMPIPIQSAQDGLMSASSIPTPIAYGLNAMVVAGIPMWPLAFASARHTIKNRNAVTDLTTK